jgi:hypothetical protein
MTGHRRAAAFGLTALALAWTFGSARTVSALDEAQNVPALSGGWKLNVEASTNPNGPAEHAAPRAPRGGRGGGGAGSGAGDISGGGVSAAEGGALGPEELQRFNASKKLLFQAPPLLGIKASREQVMILYDPDPQKGPAFAHATDNKPKEYPSPAGALAIKAKWDGQKFKREIDTAETLHVVEEYTVSADGKQLTVTVKASSRMVRNVQDGDIKRVYDRIQ